MTGLAKLRDKLTDESVAYGYTLSVWGSGTILISNTNLTANAILSFIVGGTIGFGLISFIVFKSIFTELESKENKYLVASAIHLLSSVGTVFISYLIIKTLPNTLNKNILGIIIGLNASITYNLGLITEDLISRDLYHLEKKLTQES